MDDDGLSKDSEVYKNLFTKERRCGDGGRWIEKNEALTGVQYWFSIVSKGFLTDFRCLWRDVSTDSTIFEMCNVGYSLSYRRVAGFWDVSIFGYLVIGLCELKLFVFSVISENTVWFLKVFTGTASGFPKTFKQPKYSLKSFLLVVKQKPRVLFFSLGGRG